MLDLAPERLKPLEEWLGRTLSADQVDLLARYAEWLVDEAIPAGGLGPREGERVWLRHVADSLSFAVGWRDEPPVEILDVGSGVGLPGIPLAILWPETAITLLDRGGRRIRLLHRAIRVLGLENVMAAQGDVFAVADHWHGLVFRGSVRQPETVGLSSKLLSEGGTAVVGLSRRPEGPERLRDLTGIATTMGLEVEVVNVPEMVLESPSWLLIMRASA